MIFSRRKTVYALECPARMWWWQCHFTVQSPFPRVRHLGWNAWWLLWPNNAFSGRTCVPYKSLLSHFPHCNFKRGWPFTPFQRDGSANVCCIFVVLTGIAVLEKGVWQGLRRWGKGGEINPPPPCYSKSSNVSNSVDFFCYSVCLRFKVNIKLVLK